MDGPTHTEDLPLEGEVHVYTGNVICYVSHKPDPDDEPTGWYQTVDCVDPSTIMAVSKRMALPTPDGALSGKWNRTIARPQWVV